MAVQLRRGTTAQWVAANPILSSGEPGVDVTLGKFKIGDGVTDWNSLGYATDVDSVSNVTGNLTGDVTGDLVGNVTGNVVGVVTGNIVGPGLELPHVVNKVASANIRNSHDAEVTSTAMVYTKVKTITLTNGLVGQQRFLFDIKSAVAGVAVVYGRIYRNGTALGTEQTDITGAYVTMSEDITQTWNPGDTCELWVKTKNLVVGVLVRNFCIAYDDSLTVAVASSNTAP
jgi:hypothetical protein